MSEFIGSFFLGGGRHKETLIRGRVTRIRKGTASVWAEGLEQKGGQPCQAPADTVQQGCADHKAWRAGPALEGFTADFGPALKRDSWPPVQPRPPGPGWSPSFRQSTGSWGVTGAFGGGGGPGRVQARERSRSLRPCLPLGRLEGGRDRSCLWLQSRPDPQTGALTGTRRSHWRWPTKGEREIQSPASSLGLRTVKTLVMALGTEQEKQPDRYTRGLGQTRGRSRELSRHPEPTPGAAWGAPAASQIRRRLRGRPRDPSAALEVLEELLGHDSFISRISLSISAMKGITESTSS